MIAAGHTHQASAHEVEGIAIIQAYAQGRAFGRVDLMFDRRRSASCTTRSSRRATCAPRPIRETLTCEPRSEPSEPLPPARYEGRDVTPDAAVVGRDGAGARARPRAAGQRRSAWSSTRRSRGPATPIRRSAICSPTPNANAPAPTSRSTTTCAAACAPTCRKAPLTFGRLYDAFPFDNRLVTVTLTGAELGQSSRTSCAATARGARDLRRARARGCTASGVLEIELRRDSGERIGPDERLTVAAMDSLVAGAVFAPVRPPAGFGVPAQHAPVMREVVEDWLRERGGRLILGRIHERSAAVERRRRHRLPRG